MKSIQLAYQAVRTSDAPMTGDSLGYDPAGPTRSSRRDVVPREADARAAWTHALALQATVYGTPAVLQYAQMHDQVLRPGAPGRMGAFTHQRTLAGPDFQAFRAPNVDTLYSNAWVHVGAEPVELGLPDFGGRYYTVQVVDAYSNSLNISARTVGTAVRRVWLVSSGWHGHAPAGVEVLRVATPVIWLLLRIQVLGGDVAEVHALQDRMSLLGGGLAVDGATAGGDVEHDWRAFFRALDAVLRLNGFPRDEWALVRQFAGLGLLGASSWAAESLDDATAEAMAGGFRTAQEILRSSRAQLGVPTGTGWTRVLDKGAHGHNFLARAVMNHVGLGANVAEENTSFNTYVDGTGRALTGGDGPYVVEFADPPPQAAFWSVTLYHADTGRLVTNSLGRHALGSAALGDERPVRIVLDRTDPGEDNWLPCPDGEFFLVLRIYRPGHPVVTGTWLPAPVRAR